MFRNITKIALIALIVLWGFPFRAADPGKDKEVDVVVSAIKAKLAGGTKLSAEDFKEEVARLEKISAERSKAGTGEAVGPIFLIAQVYDAIQDPTRAVETFERIVKDFPESEFASMSKNNADVLRPEAKMQQARAKLVVGADFPDFKKTDLHGRAMSVSALKGKVVLIDFWATFCPPCMAALPELKRLHKKYASEGFEILGINEDQNPEALPRAVDRLGLTWPQYHDADSELGLRYGASMLPEVYLIGRDGKIVATDEVLHTDSFEAHIRKALGLKTEN